MKILSSYLLLSAACFCFLSESAKAEATQTSSFFNLPSCPTIHFSFDNPTPNEPNTQAEAKPEYSPPSKTTDGPSLKFGGMIKADTFYDNNAKGGVYGLDDSSIPLQHVNAEAARQGHTNMTVNASRLSAEAKHHVDNMPLKGFVEIDFAKDTSTTTNAYSLRLRHAYIEVGGLTVGQTWYTFSIDNASINMKTLDNLYGSGRQAMIRYSKDFNNTTVSFAAEKPNSQYIDSQGNLFDNNNDGKSALPDIVFNAKQKFDKAHVTFSAVGRQLEIKTRPTSYNSITTTTFSKKAFGWGLGTSAKFYFYKKNALYLQAATGRGIGRYIDDLSNQDFYVEIPTVESNPFSMQVLKATNITSGFELWATEKLNLNVSASVTTIRTPQTNLNVQNFNTNQQRYLANAIYNFSKTVRFGTEILHYRRRAGTTIKNNGRDTRFLTSMAYNF